MSKTEYFAKDTSFAAERERLDLLESVYDPHAIASLNRVGLQPGWRCLDLGAGGGSMTRWIAERVGPTGSVVAIDMDTRFLRGIEATNVEIRAVDILTADVEPDAYDLAYTRFVLMHLREPHHALARLVRALRPGGWLVVQEPDFGFMMAVHANHPFSSEFDSIRRKIDDYSLAANWIDVRCGRKLPELVTASGLSDVEHEAVTWVRCGGSPAAEFWKRTFEVKHCRFEAANALTKDECDLYLRAHDDPTFQFTDIAVFTAWGRKCAAS